MKMTQLLLHVLIVSLLALNTAADEGGDAEFNYYQDDTFIKNISTLEYYDKIYDLENQLQREG